MLHAKHLKRRFGEIQAVDDVSFSIAEGESFGLLGPNGAGKSTTISMLIGLITPDSGQVELAGYGAPQSPEVRRVLGIAPQSISLYDVFTAIENLTFFCRLYHLSSAITADRIEWAFDFSGLGDRKKSRGMRPQNIPFLILSIATIAYCFVGIMMSISVIGTSEESVAGAGWGINVVMAMLGGGMVPLAFMPDFVQTISDLSPIKWAVLSLEDAIWRGFSFSEMLLSLGLLLAIGTVFGVLGSWVLSRR
ncbi:MAG: ABC transporter ATP-binding protein/permease, partial [Pirellulaceae bacterium]